MIVKISPTAPGFAAISDQCCKSREASAGALGSNAFSWINKTGTTQFRVYFATDDNNDNSRDDMGWFPGEAASGDQPELIVTYTP